MNTQHTRLAWCAGLFEGEGWIYTKPRRGGTSTMLVVGITNSDTKLLEPFLEFGGKVRPIKGTALTKKQCYDWRIYSRAGEQFLRAIIPYLHGDKLNTALKALTAREKLTFIRKRDQFGAWRSEAI